MKKLLMLTTLFGCFIGFTAAAQAAFTSKGTVVSTAAVTFSGAGTTQCTVFLKNSLNHASTTQIWWDTSVITPGVTQWKRANSYALVYSTITDVTGGIQIYTDNTGPAQNPKYTGISSTTVGGLVGYNATYPQLSSTTLSMCWRVLSSTSGVDLTAFNIRRGATGFPDRLWENSLGDSFPCWLWLTDKWSNPPTGTPANAAFPNALNGTDYVTVKDAIRGIQFAEASFGSAGSPIFVFFGADFTNALSGGITYKTTSMTIEAFTE